MLHAARKTEQKIATFPNLGHDAILVAPVGTSRADCAHLAAFLRSATRDETDALWRAVGHAALTRLGLSSGMMRPDEHPQGAHADLEQPRTTLHARLEHGRQNVISQSQAQPQAPSQPEADAANVAAGTPVWISTSGLGVPWLHVRIDDRPKYYQHAPYRTWPLRL